MNIARVTTSPTPWLAAIRVMMTNVKDRVTKTLFEEKMKAAVKDKDTFKLTTLINDLGVFINEKNADRVAKKAEKPESKIANKIYKMTPTFDQAVIDFLLMLCDDLGKIPNIDEYYVPDIDKPKKKYKTGRGGCDSDSDSDSDSDDDDRKINTIVKKDMVLCSAGAQSCKSTFTKCSAVKSMIDGFTPVIVLRNISGDAHQLSAHIDTLNKELTRYLDKHAVQKRRFQIEVIQGDKLDNVNTKSRLQNSLNGGTPCIVVCLANETQLERVIEATKDFEARFDLFIDEVDGVDYGTLKNGELCGTASALKILKEMSHQTFGVTATPLDAIFSQTELKSVNQMRLTPPDDYRGLTDLLVKILPIDVSALNETSTYKELLEYDKNLTRFLKMYSKTFPNWSGKAGKFIPNICLIKNTRLISNQIALAQGINKQYPRQFATLVYNGSGVMMYYHGMPETVTICEKQLKRNEFGDIAIADALQYFYDNGGVLKFSHIIIISGDLAGRSISFVSKNFVWHTTDMYYTPSKTTSIPEMIQSAGRLCGRNKNGSHLHLYVTEQVALALFSGYNFTNEIIARALAAPLREMDEECSFAKSLKSVMMNKRKMPIGRDITTKVKVLKKDFNLTSRVNDGGKDIKEYKYLTEEEYEAKMKKEAAEEESVGGSVGGVAEVSDDEVETELPKEEFVRLVGMFQKWSNDDTKIGMFMRNLNPSKIYTKEEIKNSCNMYGINRVRQLMVHNGAVGHGNIIKKHQDEEKYQLYPELVQEFKKYFKKQ